MLTNPFVMVAWGLVVVQGIRVALGKGGPDGGKTLLLGIVFAIPTTVFMWVTAGALKSN